MSMHEIDLTRVDLNLLVVFDALMHERHVGRAAMRLSLSQSATSHALGRLRTTFDDPLFMRHPRGVQPTVRAQELAQPIADALSQLRHILSPAPGFDPATLRRTFTVATHDYALAVLMPALVAEMRSNAPGVELRCASVDPATVIPSLDRGEFDIALGGFIGVDADRVARTELFSDRFVGIARRDHPRVKGGRMSLHAFTSLSHALMSPTGQPRGDVDEALSVLGRRRHVVATVPSFLALPYVIEGSDVIGVLPERLAVRAALSHALVLFDLPVDAGAVTCSLLVPKPLAATPEIRWLTGLLEHAASRPQSIAAQSCH